MVTVHMLCRLAAARDRPQGLADSGQAGQGRRHVLRRVDLQAHDWGNGLPAPLSDDLELEVSETGVAGCRARIGLSEQGRLTSQDPRQGHALERLGAEVREQLTVEHEDDALLRRRFAAGETNFPPPLRN